MGRNDKQALITGDSNHGATEDAGSALSPRFTSSLLLLVFLQTKARK
jgi:hypothetical protein